MASEKKTFSRRKFLMRSAIVLGGTVVGIYLGKRPIRRFLAQQIEGIEPPAMLSHFQPNFWFEIQPDNTILFKSPKIEMGQGIFTGFAMLAAEELEVTPEQIKVVHADTASGPMDKVATGGSNSTPSMFVPIREVAATMREMLRQAAAAQWGVPLSDVKAVNGRLQSGARQATYAEIAAATQEWAIPKTPALKPVSEFKYVGKDFKRNDLEAKVFGNPIYGIDAAMPGMLYACIIQSPFYKATLKSAKTAEAASWPGVERVIVEKDWIAVVAQTRHAAETAMLMVEAEWNVDKKYEQDDLIRMVTVGQGKGVNVQEVGSPRRVLQAPGGRIFRQEYRTPMAAHAQIEPNGTVAHVEKDKATIIMSTQSPGFVRAQLAAGLGMKAKNINLIPAFPGGAFGRRMKTHNAIAAALVSRAMGKPIHAFYTREQEFLYSPCRPNTHHVLQAKIDDSGQIQALHYDLATPDMAIEDNVGPAGIFLAGADIISAGHGAPVIYNVPNKSADVWHCPYPLDTGIWRSVGMFSNAFAVESFINELARETGQDPIALRIALLKSPEKLYQRYVAVLEKLREASRWDAPAGEGIGRGVAFGDDRKSIAAAVVEASLRDNRVKINKVTMVLDPGLCINPEGIRQQAEGCIMMGISAALYEELTVKGGQIYNTSFQAYPMATLADVPEIEIVLLPGDEVPYGVGEPPLAPMAPAIAAAVHELTGKPQRSLPIRLV